ncbi:hypothetical protein [Ornatilinea apprima]|uniref:hypothetical protein n=1 Tax=Ornatilinea apprima TaxID=1134406 RepID=UPI00128F55E0|nr:hypothetical protein [Ornatilinea apprima]
MADIINIYDKYYLNYTIKYIDPQATLNRPQFGWYFLGGFKKIVPVRRPWQTGTVLTARP